MSELPGLDDYLLRDSPDEHQPDDDYDPDYEPDYESIVRDRAEARRS